MSTIRRASNPGALAAAVLMVAFGAPAWAQERGVTLYTDAQFRGNSERVIRDDSNLGDDPIGADRASSVRVDRGCRARLYSETGFRGTYIEVLGSESDLGRTAIGNDRVRSIRIRCGWRREWGDDESRVQGARSQRDDRGADRNGYRSRYGSDQQTHPASRGEAYGRRQGEGATLFRDAGFRGASDTVLGDVPDLRATRVGNDAVSSIRLGRGCWARLYEDVGFEGDYIDLRFDEDYLSETPLGNDQASSVQVRCRGASRPPGYGRNVTLFRDADFRGRRETVQGDVPDLSQTRIGNDALSSLQVPTGCTARLFEDKGFRGAYLDVQDDVSELGRANDDISSLRVRCGGALGGVTLYRDGNFRGTSELFTGHVRDLGRSSVGNDEASSIEVDPGCWAVLYEDKGFEGNAVEIWYDLDRLSETPLGNDRVSSMRVFCGH